MIEAKFVERIAREVSARVDQVAKAIELFDGGAAIPFVARYRRDVTGNLSEVQLETIADQNTCFDALMNRRASILEAIEKQGKLSDEVRAKIEVCEERGVLEDLYLPFKKSRPTKATVARQKGLAPLADLLMAQDPATQDMETRANDFVRPEKAISSVEEALDGARFILAERVTSDAEVRAMIRERMLNEGQITARSTKNAEGKKTKFEAYYDFSEPVAKIPSYRVLAILRGVKTGVLRMDIAIDDERMFGDLMAHYVKEPGSPFESHIRLALEEAYHRHLRPAMEHEVVGIMRKRADAEAIRVFRENTRNLLLAPPAGRLVVLGVEPGLRTGCQLAVVDKAGAFLESRTIYPNEPLNDTEGAEAAALALLQKHNVKAIAVGNGTAARETGRFFRQLLAKHGLKHVFCVFVNEAGLSVYSTGRLAREEFPELAAGIRDAIFIARRLQDPLAELVKIEPRHIGVGQYHHDVNQRQLREGLHRTVVSCVNQVGVDLNAAPVELLRYISGIQMGTAQNIAACRAQLGGFSTRQQLLEVDGIGPKVFEQCAGFLRLPNGENPLDATAIHPEAYRVVEKIAESLAVSVAELIRNRDLIEKVKFDQFESDGVGALTLRDIRDELLKPGRDPRNRFRVPKFLDGVYSVDDLEENMETEGIVTNVTDFGAFVDVGVHQDGLVHLSELANRFVREPRQVVKVGQVVKVKVVKVDKDVPRISLSMKAVAPPPKKRPRKPRSRRPAPEQPVAAESDVPRGGRRDERPAEGRAPGRPDGKRPPRGSRERRPEDRAERSRRPGPKRQQRPAAGDRVREFGRQGSHGGSLNTQLAEQLAAIRDRFKS